MSYVYISSHLLPKISLLRSKILCRVSESRQYSIIRNTIPSHIVPSLPSWDQEESLYLKSYREVVPQVGFFHRGKMFSFIIFRKSVKKMC